MGRIRYNPWLDAGNAAEGMGGTLSQIMMAMPQLRMQQANQQADMAFKQQQVQMEREKMGMQAPVFEAQAANYNAGAARDTAETSQLGALLKAAQGLQAGTYQQYAPPERIPTKVNVERENLATQLGQLALMQSLKDPSKVGETVASARFNAGTQDDDPARMFAAAFGKWPTQIQAGANETVYDPILKKTVHGVAPAFHSSTIPLDDFKQREIFTMLMKVIGDNAATPDEAQAIVGKIAGAPPAQARPVGTTVTTAKGTFRWNGQSWDPAK